MATALVLAATRLVASSPPARAQSAPSPCAAIIDKSAAPSDVPVGYGVAITLSVRPDCPQGAVRLRVVLVLDVSGSMAGQKLVAERDAALRLVQSLDLAAHPEREVAVVAFNDAGRTYCSITNDGNRLVSCVRILAARGGTAIDEGVDQRLKELIRGRSGESPGGVEAMIVLADGANSSGCLTVAQAARRAKDQGVWLMTMAILPDADKACMRECATSSAHYYELADVGGLAAAIDRVALELTTPGFRSLRLDDGLPPNMAFVPDSDEPEAIQRGRPPYGLAWTMEWLPHEGTTARFVVAPQESGDHPTNLLATGGFTDWQGRDGSFTFGNPLVHVRDGSGLPTPTPFPTRQPPPFHPLYNSAIYECGCP